MALQKIADNLYGNRAQPQVGEKTCAELAVLGDELLRAGAPWVGGNPLPEEEMK